MSCNSSITKQNKGLKRNTIDKFYTKTVVTEECVSLVKKYIHISNTTLLCLLINNLAYLA